VAEVNKAEKNKGDKEKAISLAMEQIERAFGVGSIMKLGAGAPLLNVSSISTTSLALDRALGIGGIPKGRVTEIFGPESGGKTTLALHIAGGWFYRCRACPGSHLCAEAGSEN
jgi:recombination protein RecA